MHTSYFTGALALQTSSFPVGEDEYVETNIIAISSLTCIGNEAGLRECSWNTVSIDTDDRCTIDKVAEIVCQGMCNVLASLMYYR